MRRASTQDAYHNPLYRDRVGDKPLEREQRSGAWPLVHRSWHRNMSSTLDRDDTMRHTESETLDVRLQAPMVSGLWLEALACLEFQAGGLLDRSPLIPA